MHNAIYWFDLRLAQNKGSEFWKTITNAIILYDSMPADCLVKVVGRNWDESEAEILHQKAEPEQREVPRIRLQEYLNPVVDQRFDGIPPAVVDEDLARQELVPQLVRQVLHSPQKHELLQELFPEERRIFTPESKEQSNVEAFEHLDLTNKIQRTQCH